MRWAITVLVIMLGTIRMEGFMIPGVLEKRVVVKPVREQGVRDLIRSMESHRIRKIVVSKQLDSLVAEESKDDGIVQGVVTHLPSLMIPTVVEKSLMEHVDLEFSTEKTLWEQAAPVIGGSIWGMTILALGSYFVSTLQRVSNFMRPRGMSSPGPQSGGGGSLEVREVSLVNLTDWAGSPEIFRECYEVISFLKDSEKYQQIGARVPRGILLEGPPGTGKTLLAKAMASEAGATFFSVVASEFVEMFVGMGAARVRALFQQARMNLPAIIFIDEIDAIGKQRGSTGGFGGGGNDEREQTLNQLLSEMDGFATSDRILIIGATNRKDVLDNALLRPGRFDRIISVPLPDVESREQILKVHLNRTRFNPVVSKDIPELAEKLEGFSGAELANVVNEASIMAVRQERQVVEKTDLLAALEKSRVGIVKETDTRSPERRRRVAIHEVGHALLVSLYPKFILDKVSIQETYQGAGGYTMYSVQRRGDNDLPTREALLQRMSVMLAGKAAESVFYGNSGLSTGAAQDLQQVNQLANDYVRRMGMGETYPHLFDPAETPHMLHRSFSDTTTYILEDETSKILNEAYDLAYQQIERHRPELEPIIQKLLANKILTGDEFQSTLTLTAKPA